MKDEHPGDRQLERFVRGELPREDIPAIVRHLLTRCPRCLAVARRSWSRGDQPYGLRILLEEELASQAEASRAVPFRLCWGRREES